MHCLLLLLLFVIAQSTKYLLVVEDSYCAASGCTCTSICFSNCHVNAWWLIDSTMSQSDCGAYCDAVSGCVGITFGHSGTPGMCMIHGSVDMVAPSDSWAANSNTEYTIDTSGTVFSNTGTAGMSCYIQVEDPSVAPSVAPSVVPTVAPSNVPSASPTTSCPSSTPSVSPSSSPSAKPSTTCPSTSPSTPPSVQPSQRPSTSTPSASPSTDPSTSPSVVPTSSPSGAPSVVPSTCPSVSPSTDPSTSPSVVPTTSPSVSPSTDPSTSPSVVPTTSPSVSPSVEPTTSPSVSPSTNPSTSPSVVPTTNPSVSPSTDPSTSPSVVPTSSPSRTPSVVPSTSTPSVSPSTAPSKSPSVDPTSSPSVSPSTDPSTSPSVVPTSSPSGAPSVVPSTSPSVSPSTKPSTSPSAVPTSSPSSPPSLAPHVGPSKTPTTSLPSTTPTVYPSVGPSVEPTTSLPTVLPTAMPSVSPSIEPSQSPTTPMPSSSPTYFPSKTPSTSTPSTTPTQEPSFTPTVAPSNYPSKTPSTSTPSTTPTQEPSAIPTVAPSNYPSMSPTRTMCSNIWTTTKTLPVEIDYSENSTEFFYNSEVSSLVNSWEEDETYSMIITASSTCSSDMILGWSDGFSGDGGFLFTVSANSDEITLLSSDVIPAGTGTNTFGIRVTNENCTNSTVTVHDVQFLFGNCTSAAPTQGPSVSPTVYANETETTESAAEITEDPLQYGLLTIHMYFENVTEEEFSEHNETVLDYLSDDLNADRDSVYWSNITISDMPQRRVLSAIHDLIQASASIITFNWLEHNTMVETMEELVWQGEFSDECAALFAQNSSTFEVYITEVEQASQEEAAEISRSGSDNESSEELIGLIVGLVIVCGFCCIFCTYCCCKKEKEESDLDNIALSEHGKIPYNYTDGEKTIDYGGDDLVSANKKRDTPTSHSRQRSYNHIHE